LIAALSRAVTLIPVMPLRLCLFSLLLSGLAGCIHVKMDPIQVNAVIEVNVRVDKALDDFFGDLDKKSTTINAPKS
jgi:hypothetical protein